MDHGVGDQFADQQKDVVTEVSEVLDHRTERCAGSDRSIGPAVQADFKKGLHT
jgi:hypothetical protein